MDGIIIVNKPAGMTSADVVYRLRKLIRIKKIGHMGTLDPEAQGVLPLGVGQATRLTEYYSVQDKTYRATLTLGIVTDTQDASGQVLAKQCVHITSEELEQALRNFRGDLLQIPPMYSAVHYKGRRLYELARSGEVVQRAGRPIRINALHILDWCNGEQPQAILEVSCSKGTYIRTLCHDIGAYLGCGGHMSGLWRTRVGNWTLEEAWSLEDIASCVEDGDYRFLQEMDQGLPLTKVEIASGRRQAFAYGLTTDIGPLSPENTMGDSEDRLVQVHCQGVFLGIGSRCNGCLHPVKVMIKPE